MNDNVYAITDLENYVSEIREAAAQTLSDNYESDNLNHYITLNQMINLVKQESSGVDHENRFLVTEDANERIFEATAIWIHNAGLAKLAAQDLIECAWDDESNEMIFWAAKKEKKPNGKKPRKSRRKNMGDQK